MVPDRQPNEVSYRIARDLGRLKTPSSVSGPKRQPNCSDFIWERLSQGVRWRMLFESVHLERDESLHDVVVGRVKDLLSFYREDGGDTTLTQESPASKAFGPGMPIATISGDHIKRVVYRKLAVQNDESQVDLGLVVEEAVTKVLAVKQQKFEKLGTTGTLTKGGAGGDTIYKLEGRLIFESCRLARRLLKRVTRKKRRLKKKVEESHWSVGDESLPFYAWMRMTPDVWDSLEMREALEVLRRDAPKIRSAATRYVYLRLLDFWTSEDLIDCAELKEILSSEVGDREKSVKWNRSVEVRVGLAIKYISRFANERGLSEVFPPFPSDFDR